MLIAAGALGRSAARWPSVSAQVIPDAVPLDAVDRAGSSFTAVGLVIAALIGSAISFRRIIRIDPASAVGGA